MSLIDGAFARTRTALMVLALLFIAGIYAYADIPKESDPDINIPIIYVSMYLEGVSPNDSERILIRPMEQELASIEGLKELRSTGYLGGGNVILEFEAGFDADKALTDVREAVDKAKSELPAEADEPKVQEVNFSLFPVITITLSGDIPERTLLRMARNLQDRLETLSYVLEAPIAGDREEQVEIIINPDVIESYGLNGAEILEFFSRSNRLVAAGQMDTGQGRFAIQLPGLLEDISDILDMPVKVEGDSSVTLRNLVEVRKTFKDPENFAWFDGRKSLAIEVVKRTGENVIETIDAVKEIVADESQFWPDHVQINFSQDQSKQIKTMLTDLQNNVISAILLVMIVCVAALGLRGASLVGIAIPGSFLTGLLVLYLMGLTINVVVLFALILSVGMLVDGAIVVTEYADREMMEGQKPRDAYFFAAKRMAWPIIASTATTLAAFLPLLFWPGIVGEFMFYLPLTLIATLVASLLMALVFVPAIGALIGKPAIISKEKQSEKLSYDELLSLKGPSGVYVGFLNKALRFPGTILLIALAMLIGVQWYYATHGNGVEFFPTIEPEYASVLVHARGNLSVHEQDDLVKEVVDQIKNIDGIDHIYARSGASASSGNDLAEDVIGQIQLEFSPWDTRKTADEIFVDIRAATKNNAGLIVETRKAQEGPKSGKALQIQLRAYDAGILDKTADDVLTGLDFVGEFIDIEDTRPIPGIEWELQVDRAQAAKFGLDTTLIGNSIRIVTNGLKAAEYRPDDSDEEVDVVIRHAPEFRTLDQLDRVKIETGAGSIPVSNFVTRVAKEKVGQVNRVDQQKSITIKADLPPTININDKIKALEAYFSDNPISPLVRFAFKGDNENQQESQAFLMGAFIVALFIMAIILVTQFNSFYSALLILSAVIMSTIGVFMGLIITGQPFGIVMSGVGVIALAGIVVNNNIVLIDTFDYLRDQNNRLAKKSQKTILHLITLTGYQRLRPVVLTTITTVLGLLPMVLQMNIDFVSRDISIGAPSTQWWVGLATAICFGLIFSTILTLVVTPAALMYRVKLTSYKIRLFDFIKRKVSFS